MSVEVEKWITVDVDLDDFDDEDLLDEIERRGLDLDHGYTDSDEIKRLLVSIWEKKRLGQDFTRDLEDLIYYGIGKVI